MCSSFSILDSVSPLSPHPVWAIVTKSFKWQWLGRVPMCMCRLSSWAEQYWIYFILLTFTLTCLEETGIASRGIAACCLLNRISYLSSNWGCVTSTKLPSLHKHQVFFFCKVLIIISTTSPPGLSGRLVDMWELMLNKGFTNVNTWL